MSKHNHELNQNTGFTISGSEIKYEQRIFFSTVHISPNKIRKIYHSPASGLNIENEFQTPMIMIA
jgi:hypothetical protein